MQWDKVKNILIAILLTINLFLLGNLAVRGWQSHRRTSELEANLRTLVSARGMQLDTAFSFPEDITLPELSLDRSRADEEKIASAMLGEHAERTEQEDGHGGALRATGHARVAGGRQCAGGVYAD